MNNNKNTQYLLNSLVSFQEQIQNLEKIIKNNDYQSMIQSTSDTINHVYEQNQLLYTLLDIRSYGYMNDYQFKKALTDREKMIEIAPTSTTGYARTGHLLSMYGYQLRAIKVYDQGLDISLQQQQQKEAMIPHTTDQRATHVSETDELESGKAIAVQQSEIYIDPFQILPEELLTNIVACLPQNIKLTCIQVSKSWRFRILGCIEAWNDFALGKEEYENKNMALLSISSHFGHHVQNLTMNTDSPIVWSSCMKKLQQEHFGRIRSLQITVNRGILSLGDYVTQTSLALQQIQNTLTKLSIHVGIGRRDTISVATLLMLCSSLTDLVYSAERVPSSYSFCKLMGDFNYMLTHPRLENLELQANDINGGDIGPILATCPQLRRLVLQGGNYSIPDALVSAPTSNLEILGLNPLYNDNVPQLLPLQKKKISNNTLLPRNRSNKNDISSTTSNGGLWGLYMDNPKSGFPVTRMLPFLYKNRATLKKIRLCMLTMPMEQLHYIHTTYPHCTFSNVTKLVAWPYTETTQDFISRSIHNSTTLTDLVVILPYNINTFINKTIKNLPRLQQLELQHVKNKNSDDRASTTANLIQLFNRYSRLSSSPTMTSLSNTNNNNSSSLFSPSSSSSSSVLQVLKLRWCDEVLTDNVLASITGIKSLCHIELTGLHHVTTEGLHKFFNSPLSDQIKFVDIAEIDAVTDDLIIRLGDLKHVNTIWLQGLKSITDDGIRGLVDKLYTANNKYKKWTTFILLQCPSITDECISYATTKVSRMISDMKEINHHRYYTLIHKLMKASYTIY